MSVLNQSGDEQVECPLCMEPLEVDDLNFFPCTCGYQICRFCWHRIRTDENGLCPACRKGYPENPADFKPLSQEEVAKLKAEKRHKDQQRKQKITDNRKHLANVRVVQRNLVFVVGLPMRLADSEVLKKHEYFGKFGKIHKVVINQCTSYAGTQGPSASAYVTYQRADDALRAIQAVNNISVDGRSIKSSLGTTKYCSHFMKNQACPKQDCMYLHDQGDCEASFTKEDMQQGKHQEYERKLHEALIATTARERKPTPSPPATAAVVGKEGGVAKDKEAWPSLQAGPPTNGNTASANGKAESRKQNGSKSVVTAKKRHSSGDDDRGRSLAAYPELLLDHTDDSTPSETSESAESDESAAVRTSDPVKSLLAARLFEPDNNSFFSSNSFAKVNSDDAANTGVEWSASAHAMSDVLMPTVHPAEDWEAAFGFTPADNPRRVFTSLHSQLAPDTANHRLPQQRLHNGTSKFFSQYHSPDTAYHHHQPYLEPHQYLEPQYSSNAPPQENGFAPQEDGEVNDDWGFDLFHETQKALAELMEKETAVAQPPPATYHRQQHHPAPPQFHTQPHRSPASNCSRLLDGLGLGQTAQAARTRLPPPGFSAPNHMNSFGLGIPRPAHTASKILPFLSRNNNNSNGSLSPQPTAANYRPTANGQHFSPKEWFEHAPASKGWTGPCTDWTALDPAIVSSSRHHAPPAPHGWNAYFGGAAVATQDWSAPPPGFGTRQAAGGTGGADINKLEAESTFLCF